MFKGSIPPSIRTRSYKTDSVTGVTNTAKSAILPKHTLEGLLLWGQREQKGIQDLLNLVPPEMEEYNVLQDRLEKLTARLAQIQRQLAA